MNTGQQLHELTMFILGQQFKNQDLVDDAGKRALIVAYIDIFNEAQKIFKECLENDSE